MTWIDFVKTVFPAMTDGEARRLLFEATAFPCSTRDQTEARIIEWASQANDIDQILYLAYGKMDVAWDDLKREEYVNAFSVEAL